MSQDSFRTLLEAFRAGLQAEVDAKLAELQEQQSLALAEMRRVLEAEVEGRWAARLETLRGEWAARLESQRAAADIEAARRTLAERHRLTAELERTRQERHAFEEDLKRTEAALRAANDTAEQARQQSSALAAAQAAERQARLSALDRLVRATRRVAAARSLSEALGALAAAAADEVPRTALFLVNGSRLQAWKGSGFPTSPGELDVERERDSVLGAALAGRVAVSTAVATAPAFAGLPPHRAGLAVPIAVGGHAVAVLYADDGADEAQGRPAAWPEALELLALHASEHLGYLTALRTAQAAGHLPALGPVDDQGADAIGAARRYAQLLVSELKMSNEAAVSLGRERRDLLDRLGSQIDRARRLYEERVPPTVAARNQYFDHELLHTLAGGDAALLGVRA